MKILTVQQIEHITTELAHTKLFRAEHSTDFGSRFPHILEGCLITPFEHAGDEDLYPSLISKAGILFYLMVKTRPFEHGNRRIAITALLVFLHNSGKWLKVDRQQFSDFIEWVAQSPPALKEQVLSGIELFIRTHLVSL